MLILLLLFRLQHKYYNILVVHGVIIIIMIALSMLLWLYNLACLVTQSLVSKVTIIVSLIAIYFDVRVI